MDGDEDGVEGRIGSSSKGGGLFGRGQAGKRNAFRNRGGRHRRRGMQDRDLIDSLNDRTLQSVLRFVDEKDGWEHVTTAENVTVYRKYLDLSNDDVVIDDEGHVCEEARADESCCSGAKQRFACVKVCIDPLPHRPPLDGLG